MTWALRFAITAALWGLARAAYSSWHAIDEEQVICPVITRPTGYPAGAFWPTTKEYETTIAIDTMSGMNPSLPHIVSFIRDTSKTAAMSITYEVTDGLGQVIIPSTVQSLSSTAPPAMGNLCQCLGTNGNIGLDSRNFPADYGKQCAYHDYDHCHTWWPGLTTCCRQWCYVNKSCPDSLMASANYGAYYSYSGACPSAIRSPCTFNTPPPVSLCSCQNIDNYPQWSSAYQTSFGAGYGATCSTWDMTNCNDPAKYAPQFVDTWCCQSWCWVNSTCSNAIPSKVWPGLFWTNADCPDNNQLVAQCPFKPQPQAVGGTTAPPSAQYCACIGYSPKTLHSSRRRANGVTYPSDYGATCKAHDISACASFFPPPASTGIFCCQKWCYVDEDCSTANPSAIAAGFYWSYSPYQCSSSGQSLRTCTYSTICNPTGVNTGVSVARTWTPAMPSNYGKTCAPHDETNCKAWWQNDPSWSSTNSGNDWCCKSWTYVEEACPTAEEGLAGLAFSYEICEDQPSTTSNARTWNGNACVAAGGRLLQEDATQPSKPSLRGHLLDLDDDSVPRKLNMLPAYLKGKVTGGGTMDSQRQDTDSQRQDTVAAAPSSTTRPAPDNAEDQASPDSGATVSPAEIAMEKAFTKGTIKSGGHNFEKFKSLECGGKAYTNDPANGCNGWGSLTVKDCLQNCIDDKSPDACPQGHTCHAAVFYPSGHTGWCHLFEAAECRNMQERGTPSTYRLQSRRMQATNDADADSDADTESDTTETRRLSSRRRGRSRRRAPTPGRRRAPPPSPAATPRRRFVSAGTARRRTPTRVSASGRRRGTGSATAVSARRRAAPAGVPPGPTPAPANHASAGRRRASPAPVSTNPNSRRRMNANAAPSATSGRRRVNPVADSRRRAPAPASRRRGVSIGGSSYTTDRRRGSASASSGTRRRTISYGYTTPTRLTNNFGGTPPYKSSYGYTGPSRKKYSTTQMVMAGVGGAAGGAILAFGGYYAYKRYSQGQLTASARGVDMQWCRVPDTNAAGVTQANRGDIILCKDCYQVYGPRCPNKDQCYSGGCNWKLEHDTYRDDLLATGFVPSTYTSPIKIKITAITGTDWSESIVCPKDNTGLSTAQFVANSVVRPDLYVTLAEMDTMATSVCTMATYRSCSSNANCPQHASCNANWCECLTGYCYVTNNFTCIRSGVTSFASQVEAPWMMLFALLFLRIFRSLH